MPERDICGACRGPWPCECSPRAVPVVVRVDPDIADELAAGLRRRDETIILHPYEDSVRDVTWGADNARGGELICGHYRTKFDLDTDQRLVSCRDCHAILDPYDALARLAILDRRTDMRLRELRVLENAAAEHERARIARAAARRHPYVPHSRRDPITRAWGPEACATCGGQRPGDIHNAKERSPRRTRASVEKKQDP